MCNIFLHLYTVKGTGGKKQKNREGYFHKMQFGLFSSSVFLARITNEQ